MSLFLVVLIGGALGIRTLWTSSEIATMVASIYPGVTLTFAGAFLVLIWGIIDGAIRGAIFAWLYNWLSRKIR